MSITVKTLTNETAFIKTIKDKSNNTKKLSLLKDSPKKIINDEFTKKLNTFFSTEPNMVNKFLSCVYDCFSNIEKVAPVLFVFKGGNVIKLWAVKKQLEQFGIFTNSIQDILQEKVTFFEKDTINGYSDFDFSLYVNYDKFDENLYNTLVEINNPIYTANYNETNKHELIYKELLSYITCQMFKLRQKLENLVINNTNKEFNNNLSTLLDEIDLHNKILDYLHIDINFKLNFSALKSIKDLIITKEPTILLNDTIVLYELNRNNSMNISFNNTIKIKNNNNIITDFDLLRIKLPIIVNNNQTFKSEIFDLSVLRKDDDNSNKFNTIKGYITKLTFNNNDKLQNISVYNNYYVLQDLLNILFLQQSIFPWKDKKYEKRAIRLGVIFATYLDEINKPNTKFIDYDENILMLRTILLLCTFIGNIESYMSIDANDFNIILSIVNSCIPQRIIKNDTNVDKDMIKDPCVFIFNVINLLINKIFVDKDIVWCNVQQNEIYNITYYQNEFLKFCKTFVFYFISSLSHLTNLENLFTAITKNCYIQDIPGGAILQENKIKTQISLPIQQKKTVKTVKTIETSTRNRITSIVKSLMSLNKHYNDYNTGIKINGEIKIRKIEDNHIKNVFDELKKLLYLKEKVDLLQVY